MIGRSGERGSGISVLAARHDDDDDNNQQKKMRTCRIVNFAVPADHKVKLKECEKRHKYLDLARELK